MALDDAAMMEEGDSNAEPMVEDVSGPGDVEIPGEPLFQVPGALNYCRRNISDTASATTAAPSRMLFCRRRCCSHPRASVVYCCCGAQEWLGRAWQASLRCQPQMQSQRTIRWPGHTRCVASRQSLCALKRPCA